MVTQPRRLRAVDVPDIPVTDPGISGYELVNGELVPVTPAWRAHSWLLAELGRLLGNHVRSAGSGSVFADVWCHLALPYDPERLRGPDVAYVSKEKLTRGTGRDGILQALPDLVIEIYSSSNDRKRKDFQRRIRDYVDAGVRLLWVIYPEERYAMVHRPDGSARFVRDSEVLDGEDVLPGFAVDLRALFDAIP